MPQSSQRSLGHLRLRRRLHLHLPDKTTLVVHTYFRYYTEHPRTAAILTIAITLAFGMLGAAVAVHGLQTCYCKMIKRSNPPTVFLGPTIFLLRLLMEGGLFSFWCSSSSSSRSNPRDTASAHLEDNSRMAAKPDRQPASHTSWVGIAGETPKRVVSDSISVMPNDDATAYMDMR